MKDDRATGGKRQLEPCERAPYQKPELTEWGSIVEITFGGLQATEDFPILGGSQPA